MSAKCLATSAVPTAAWLEAGMIARFKAREGIPLSIEFVNDQLCPNTARNHYGASLSFVVSRHA